MTSKGIPKIKMSERILTMNNNFENAIAFAQAIETAVESKMTRDTINALIVLKPTLKEDILKLNDLLSSVTTTATATITTTEPTTTTETSPAPTPDTTAPTTTTTRFKHPTIKELSVTPGGQLFCGEKKLKVNNNSGYAVVHFTTAEKGHVTANAARLAYEAANNVLLSQKYIMQFRDGDKMNIRPDNMYVVERGTILPQHKRATSTTETTTTTTTPTTPEIQYSGKIYNHPEIEGLVVNDKGDIFFNGEKLKKLIHSGKVIVWVKINGKRVSKTAARLIYEATHNVSLERKFIIGYKDGNPENLRPGNIYTKKADGRQKGSGIKTKAEAKFAPASSEGANWRIHPTYTDVEVNSSTGEIRYKGEVAPILDKGGYPNINMGYAYKNASKIIYEAVHGCTLPETTYVGPIDGDKFNLDPANLRINPKLKGSEEEKIEKISELSELIRDHADACDTVSSILRLIVKEKPHLHTTFYFVDKMLKGGFSKITEKYFSVVNGKIVPVTNDEKTTNMSRDLVTVARKLGIEKAHEILLNLIEKGSFEPNMADMAIAIIENMYDDCHKVRSAADIQKTVLEFYGFNTPLFLIDSIRTKTKYRDIIESMVK
jgi:hypothetical protein